MSGRSLGPGSLKRVQRGNTPPTWLLTYTAASGTRRRQSLSTDRSVAIKMQAEIIRQRDLEMVGLGSFESQSMPLVQVVEQYLADLKTRATPKFVAVTEPCLRRALDELRVVRVRDLATHAVLQWRARLVAEGASHSTANRYVARLFGVLTWAVKSGLIGANRLNRIDRLPESGRHQRRRRRAMSDDEIRRFLEAAEADDRDQQAYLNAERSIAGGTRGPGYAREKRSIRIPQAPLWRTLLETGGRYGETISATWGDVDLDAGTLRLRAETTKASRERLLPLLDDLVARLRELRKIHAHVLCREPRNGERVFLTPRGLPWCAASNNLRRVFLRVLTLAGIERVDANGRTLDIHALRHTTGSRMARNGVPLHITQRMLGHSTPTLTMRHYVHLDVEDLRAGVERAANEGRPAKPRLVRAASLGASA